MTRPFYTYLLPWAAALVVEVDAFRWPVLHSQALLSYNKPTTTHLFSSTPLLSLDRNTPREIDAFQQWAGQCGVQPDNGFCLGSASIDETDDWFAGTSTGGPAGSRVLYVPGEMILSANMLAEEYNGYVDKSLHTLERMGLEEFHLHFHLWLKILLEYEQGSNSPYAPWMAALPRKWNTAVSMDDFCLECLPPFLKSLCAKQRYQLTCFREALQKFEFLAEETKKNTELMKFAYNVVFTRAFPSEDGDLKIVPMADMLNHDYYSNVALTFDAFGSCEVILTNNVEEGSMLTLCYGEPTNPSRFLARFGFLNEDAPACFCKLYFAKPSPELIEVGYDPEQMLFGTMDGAVSQQVWDVLLYSRLERKKNLHEARHAFYQAVTSGDIQTKEAIHAEFQEDTRKALLRHVDHILIEVNELLIKMNSFDASKHPRLPLLKKHHRMVIRTFGTVRENLTRMEAETMAMANSY